jgi:hypothetical protein
MVDESRHYHVDRGFDIINELNPKARHSLRWRPLTGIWDQALARVQAPP